MKSGESEQVNTMLDYKTPSDLLAAGYTLHHTATHPGYHTRKSVTTAPYEGRFGNGFRVHKAHPTSTQFHIVEYWIKEDD